MELPAKSLDTILRDLTALRERQRSDASVRVPEAILRLRSGASVTGVIGAYATSRDGGAVVVVQEATGASYVAVDSIECIHVREPELLLPLPAPPTKLALKRRLADLAASREAAGEQVPAFELTFADAEPKEAELRSLSVLLEALEQAWPKVAADPLGQQALATKVKQVLVAVGQETGASLEMETLRISIELSARKLEAATLVTAIERQL